MRSVQVTNDVSGSTGDQVTAQGCAADSTAGNRPRIISWVALPCASPPTETSPRKSPEPEETGGPEPVQIWNGIDLVSALAQQAEIQPSLVVVYAGHNQYNKTIMASELVEYTRLSERW